MARPSSIRRFIMLLLRALGCAWVWVCESGNENGGGRGGEVF